MAVKRSFYQNPTLKVAKELLGKYLVRELENGERLEGRIVETEAYCGPEDLACHSSRGRTKRTEVMFGPAGHAYVYLIYGMHHCLNVVTGEAGAAVLIRALEPTATTRDEVPKDVASGPGKLCRFMKIGKNFNGWDLTKGEKLWIEDRKEPTPKIVSAPRVGVAYAKEYAKKPWRFYIKNSSCVSQGRQR